MKFNETLLKKLFVLILLISFNSQSVPDIGMSHSLSFPTEQISTTAFHPQGKILALGLHDSTIHIINIEKKNTLATLDLHKHKVSGVAFSPDGSILVSGSCVAKDYSEKCIFGEIIIWDTTTWKKKLFLRESGYFGHSFLFSRGGDKLYVNHFNGTISLINTKSWEKIKSIETQEDVNAFSVDDDETTLITGSKGHAFVWNVTTKSKIALLPGKGMNEINSILILEDDSKVFIDSCESDDINNTCLKGIIDVWDTSTWEKINTITAHNESIISMTFTSDKKYIVTSSYDKTIKIWDKTFNTVFSSLSSFLGKKGNKIISFSPNNKYLVYPSKGLLIFYDVFAKIFEGKIIPVDSYEEPGIVTLLQSHTDNVHHLSFSDNSHFLVSASKTKKEMFVWNTDDWKPFITSYDLPYNGIGHFTPDSQSLLISSFSPIVESAKEMPVNFFSIDLYTLKKDKKSQFFHIDPINNFVFSFDNKLLAKSYTRYDKIKKELFTHYMILNATSNDVVNSFSRKTEDTNTPIVFSDKGDFLITTDCELWEDGNCLWPKIIAWDLLVWVEMKSFLSNKNSITSIAISQNDEFLASGSCANETAYCENGEIIVWDAFTWRQIKRLVDSKDIINSLLFSSDGKYLVSSSLDGTIRVYETENWEIIDCWTPHFDNNNPVPVSAIALSNNNEFLASSGSKLNEIKIWDFKKIVHTVDTTHRCKTVEKKIHNALEKDTQEAEKNQEELFSSNVKKKQKIIGKNCKTNSECETKNCINRVCCIQGKTCCVFDKMCQEGEICSKEYYCVNKDEQESTPGSKKYIVYAIALFVFAAFIIIALGIVLYFVEEDEEEEFEEDDEVDVEELFDENRLIK